MRPVFLTAALIVIAAGAALAQEEVVFKNYNLKHISLTDPVARQKVESELRKIVSANGRFILDERSNTIIVRDSEMKQNEVARALAKLDVKGEEETASVTITVRVAYVEASAARKALEEASEKDQELKGLKISHSDETCAVILTGTANQLEKAKAIIDALEKKFRTEVETKVYKVRNRSAKSMADIVRLHLAGAPGTGVAIDEVTNTLLVRETRANHARVMEVLKKFDTELATVLLQFRVVYASREAVGVDESIKDVAAELQKLFSFTRYRAEEAPVVKVQQGHPAQVEDSGSGLSVSVRSCDYDRESGKIRIEGLKISKKVAREDGNPSTLTISTTIKVDEGHCVVIGGAASKNAKDALIVALKATIEK